MTKPVTGAMALSVLVLLLVPSVSAHEAPPPREFETRLLQDCTDDYFGGDSPNRPGYDLHSLDLREAWRPGLGDSVGFRVVANGEGQGEIRLEFRADGSTHAATWSTSSGSSWSGSGFDAVEGPSPALDTAGNQDGGRFVLDGWIALSGLGVASGDAITHYTLTGYADGEEGDHVPGYDDDRVTAPGCQDNYQRPPSQGYTLEGPVQYAGLSIDPAQATLPVDIRQFIDLEVENLLRSTSDDRVPDQEVTLTFQGGAGLDVDLHDPASGEYTQRATFTLDARQSNVVHLAVLGEQPGAQGTVDVTLTTEYGGRAVETFSYTVAEDDGPTTEDPGPTGDDNGTPMPGALAAIGLLGAALWMRRQ